MYSVTEGSPGNCGSEGDVVVNCYKTRSESNWVCETFFVEDKGVVCSGKGVVSVT